MNHTFKNIKFLEQFLPSKRHRILRTREVTGNFTVEFQDVTPQDAPIAVIQRRQIGNEFGSRHRCEYRFWNGLLWARTKISHHWCLNKEKNRASKWRDVLRYFGGYSYHLTQDEVQAKLDKHAVNYINIDGIPYREIGIPRYVVMTFGLGCNHGGTALMTDNFYNSNIPASSYFRCDQRQEAVALAKQTALARGDTESVPIKPHGEFEVLIPEAVFINPSAEHGDGDPFINKINNLTKCKNPMIAGLGAIALAFRA